MKRGMRDWRYRFLLIKMYLCKLVRVLKINKAKPEKVLRNKSLPPHSLNMWLRLPPTHKLAVSLPRDSGER